MSTLALCPPYQPLLRTVNTGSSPESRTLERALDDALQHFRDTAPRSAVFENLFFALFRSQTSGWDGYNAPAVGLHEAWNVASRFLAALPADLPAPEVGIDPDGEVGFDWRGPNERVLTVSLANDGQLSYAGLFRGGATAHGTEMFEDVVPQTIIQLIKRLEE